MRYRRLARFLFGPLLPIALIPGCLSLHRDRPVVVLVQDAETKRPVPGAEVQLSYPYPRSSAPDEISGKTGSDGIVRLKTAPNGLDAAMIRAASEGHLPESKIVSDAFLEEIKPAGPFQSIARRPVNFTLDLYSGPPFSVELILPTGYRGLVKADMRIQDNLANPPGQRTFAFTVSQIGSVEITGPGVLQRVKPAMYIAKYADGAVLGSRMDNTKVGFKWLRHEGNTEYFVVGTEPEYDNFHRQLFQTDGSTPDKSEPSRGGGGRGGHGGRSGGGGRGGGGGGGGGNFGGAGGFNQ